MEGPREIARALSALIHVESSGGMCAGAPGARLIVVSTNFRDRDVASFVKEAKARMEKDVKLPPGYFLKWGDGFENLERATNRLLIVVPIALFLISILLFTTFQYS